MKHLFLITTFILLLVQFGLSQTKAFDVFDKAVAEQPGGFSGNKEKLSEIFNQERIRLGDKFEIELWTYAGADFEKYYWLSLFVSSESYLHGNKPLPQLAFKLMQIALQLISDTIDEESLRKKTRVLRPLAVRAYKIGNLEAALTYKTEAESVLSKNDRLRTSLPALNAFDYCIYQNLEKDPNTCKEGQTPVERMVYGGVINGKALRLEKPKYPKEARKNGISGAVTVQLVIGLDGSIESAKGIKGPSELYEAAEKAAMKSKFSPTTLEGKPVKVSGVIVYVFKP